MKSIHKEEAGAAVNHGHWLMMVSQWHNKDSEVNDEDTMKLVLKVFIVLSDGVCSSAGLLWPTFA